MNWIIFSRISAIISAAIFGCCLSQASFALTFSQISQVYFFGDSLTDSGFYDAISPPPLPAIPAGKAPTFTTFGGYTWAQYIARDIKGFVLPIYPGPSPADTITNNSSISAVPHFTSGTLMGINYAAGGSTTNSIGESFPFAPSLHQQIAFYLSTAPQILDPNAVYFIWSGANDFVSLLGIPLPTELQLLQTANTAAINIANEVATLSARGAKRIVVISLPNIGSTPLISELAMTSGIATLPAMMKTVTFTFNSMLNQQLGAVIAQYGVKILYIDSYDILDNVILATEAGQPYVVAGQSFQFVNATTPACASVLPLPALYCPNTAPTNYIFADTLHPTDMAHRVLSLEVEQAILNWQ
jgi:outer membrane lipase/esterase